MLDDDKGGLTRSSLAGAQTDPAGQRQERRTGQRHMSILRVGKMITARGEDFCLIRNISDGGLMARTYRAVEPGEHVVVELRGERKLGGVIRWVREDSAGMQFDEPVDAAALLADREDAADGRRPRAPRLTRACRATLRVGAHYHRVTVRDVSQGGVKVAIPTELPADAGVVVTMEGFRPVPGVIRWWKDNNAGIAFNQVIPYSELTAWLRDTVTE